MCEKGNGWERGRNGEIPPSMRRKLWFSDWVYFRRSNDNRVYSIQE